MSVIEQGLVASPVTVMYSTKDLANSTLYPIGMQPVLEQDVPGFPVFDDTQFYDSNDFRGSLGANGIQGLDATMYQAKLPWSGIDQATLDTINCINLNRTPFYNDKLDDPLIGIHDDYLEPEIFQAAVAISLLGQAR